MRKLRSMACLGLAIVVTLSIGILPVMQSVKAVDKVYNISIFSDDTVPVGDNAAPCDLAGLSQLYMNAGHNVSLIDRLVLSDETQFNTNVCDIVVIPTGENFPLEAIPNFKRFVKSGGRVIALGGFAFSNLLNLDGNAVKPFPSKENKDQLLGSNAPVYAQDQLGYDPSQLPIFDEEHYYDSGVSIRPAEDQAVFEGELELIGSGLITGYSAITTTGNYSGRWQPLIYAYDHVGTRVGTVGAIFRIYSEPCRDGYQPLFPTWEDYSGTSIAFFGVTSHDLLADGNENLRNGFVKLLDVLMEDTYIASIDNKFDNYKQGEKPEFDVYVENGSALSKSGKVELDIISEDTGAIVDTLIANYSVEPKSRQTVHVTWENSAFEDDFYQVNARVLMSDNTLIDRYQTGFSVWNDAVIANGPKYIYEDNYIKLLRDDGTYKTIFATGVDDGANLFINEDQTPLVWKQEFIRRQDTGMYIYECLQQYRHASDFAHLFASPESLEKHYRSVDNVVYMSQKYGQIYMMGIAIGNDVSANGDNLEKIAQDVSNLAQRYQTVPGLMYYLNGDLVCRVSNEKNKDDFNAFLTGRYGNSNNLNKAWGTFDLELGNVDLDSAYDYNGEGWSDIKAYDINLFKTTMITRWTSRLYDAICQTGQQDKAVLCEFYSWPAESVDIPLALGEMTYSNIGFFLTRQQFAQMIAYSDQRFQGKSFGIGETGRRTHPAFRDADPLYASYTYEESRDFFFTGLISTYAMGGNHYQQWCWNDESKYVFPWGMNFTGDKAPRDLYYWFRNTNFVMKQAEPVYEVPKVAVILPDSTRASGNASPLAGHYGAINAIDVLQRTNVGNILTLNESNLVIDPAIKVIFYPLAYTMPQDVYDTLKAWVEQGGTLYISGDFTYDPIYRTRDFDDRLMELAGVKSININYPGLDSANCKNYTYSDGVNFRFGKLNLEIELAGAEAIYSSDDEQPVITQFALGDGTVIYSCDPLEASNIEHLSHQNVSLYNQILEIAGIKNDYVQTAYGNIKLFRLALADGGVFYELLNAFDADASGTLNTDYHSYNYETLTGNADYIWEDAAGNLLGAFTEGDLYRDGVKILSDGAYAQVTSMDGQDLSKSRRIVVTPQQTGTFSLYTEADWSNLTIRIGQVENGRWVDMGQVLCACQDGYITFEVMPDMVNAIVIIGVKGFAESLGHDGFGFMVADTLVNGGAKNSVAADENGGVSKIYGGPMEQFGPGVPPVSEEQPQPAQPVAKQSNQFLWIVLGTCAISAAVAVVIIQKRKELKNT